MNNILKIQPEKEIIWPTKDGNWTSKRIQIPVKDS